LNNWKKPISTNGFCGISLLKKYSDSNSKNTTKTWFIKIGFVVALKDKPLGKSVEIEFHYKGKRKTAFSGP